eukprot:COSAG01_NODE_676_length_14324_cov_17.420105_14_plen_135_part_00
MPSWCRGLRFAVRWQVLVVGGAGAKGVSAAQLCGWCFDLDSQRWAQCAEAVAAPSAAVGTPPPPPPRAGHTATAAPPSWQSDGASGPGSGVEHTPHAVLVFGGRTFPVSLAGYGGARVLPPPPCGPGWPADVGW